jgi:tRNA threonylcarbamoyladenosine biosynthesis protein TsaB
VALLLSFDTATKHCAVALSDDDRLLAHRVEDGERFNHAEKLNVFIEAVLKDAGKSMRDLDAIAVGIGPGSYTGLRIGLSAAKGLCFALDVPLIGLGTLDVLGHELQGSGFVAEVNDVLHPMVDARRMEVFTKELHAAAGSMQAARPVVLDDVWCTSLTMEHRHIVFGDGADKAAELWSRHERCVHIVGVRPSVNGLAIASHRAFQRKDFADLAYLVPDYGKEANVTQPTKGRPL